MKGLSLKLCIGVLILVLTTLLSAVCAEDGHPVARQGAQGTIDITADKHTKDGVFDGNVTWNQGDVRLACDRLVIVYDESKSKSVESQGKKLPAGTIKSITATGNVKITQNDRMATADRALWDYAKQTITLTEGSPRLWRRGDYVSGHRIIMYLDENYAAIEAGLGESLSPPPKPSKEKEPLPRRGPFQWGK